MNKFKNAMRHIGDAAKSTLETGVAVTAAYGSYTQQVDELAYKLMQKTYGLELQQAKLVARTLIRDAEITWKW